VGVTCLPNGIKNLRAGLEMTMRGMRMRYHAVRVAVIGLGVVAVACFGASDPMSGPAPTSGPAPAGLSADAQAVLFLGFLQPGVESRLQPPVCVALAPPLPPNLAPHQGMEAPLDSLSELPGATLRELRSRAADIHPLSDCTRARRADSTPEFRLRSTGQTAGLIWMRNAVLTSDSTAQALVGNWVHIDHQGEFKCETIRRDGVWRRASCRAVWAT